MQCHNYSQHFIVQTSKVAKTLALNCSCHKIKIICDVTEMLALWCNRVSTHKCIRSTTVVLMQCYMSIISQSEKRKEEEGRGLSL